jgi:hypothetical protein
MLFYERHNDIKVHTRITFTLFNPTGISLMHIGTIFCLTILFHKKEISKF